MDTKARDVQDMKNLRVRHTWQARLGVAFLALSGAMIALPSAATVQGEQRRDARDTRQDARQDSRTTKANCRAANQKSNASC